MAEKEKKQNAVQRFMRETVGELRKVSWPTWSEVRQLTGIVLVVMVVMGAALSLVDLGAGLLIDLALGV